MSLRTCEPVKEKELTPRQRAFVAHVAAGATIRAAAGTIGLSERQARAWMTMPPIRGAIHAQVDEIVERAASLAVDALPDALDTLKAIMGDAKQPPAARVAAARTIVDAAGRLSSSAIFTRRLAELETQLREEANDD